MSEIKKVLRLSRNCLPVRPPVIETCLCGICAWLGMPWLWLGVCLGCWAVWSVLAGAEKRVDIFEPWREELKKEGTEE